MPLFPLIKLRLLAVSLGLLSCISAAGAARRPNVILIITDDQGYGDLACHGNPMIRTPNLDRLHGESVRLTNYHVDPTCSPTRAALLTGRYSTRTGVWHTVMGRSLMHRDEVTLADVLNRAGYRTALFGKWHLGDNYPMRPQDRGFQETLWLGGGGIGQTPDHWGNDYYDDTYLRNGRPEKFTGYCTDVFFDEAMRFIEANRTQPFFAYIATNVPHSPFIVPDKYRRPYTERGVPAPMDSFYGMIENMDENVGRLMERLHVLGLAENTILIWTTDNGTGAGLAGVNRFVAAAQPDGGWNGFTAGMRGHKGTEYDGGHRVPFFLRWPAGGLAGGRDVTQLTAHLDLLPTLAGLCDVPLPQDRALDGRSLVPLLRGEDNAWTERTLFAHVQRKEIPPKWDRSAVMTDRWRLVNGGELYDMERDPGQATNIAEAHPAVVAQLRDRYEVWWTSLQPALGRHSYIVVGANEENPARITCMDWHNDDIKNIPFLHRQIEEAREANGYWMIEMARPGRYEFTLRQQPAEAPFPLQATHARLIVGEREASAEVPAGAAGVTLALDLPAGPARMQTWLTDGNLGKSRGAFYLEVRRLD